MAVNILVPLKTILKNAIFFYLSVASCIVPALVVSLFSYEFGSILGMPRLPFSLSWPMAFFKKTRTHGPLRARGCYSCLFPVNK
jgi:hypothetical protein